MDYPELSAKEAVVLRLLIGKSEMYGLELVNSSDGQLGRGTVYVTLGRMEDKGYVTSTLDEVAPGNGPPRRRYSVTGLGARAYLAMQQGARVFAGLEGAWAM